MTTDHDRPASAEYEFSAAQNETFAGLADIVGFVAVLILLLGGLGVAAGALNLSIGDREALTAGVLIGEGLIGIVIGTRLRLAAGSFDEVATTGGADISHLMYALTQLGRVFRLQAWLLGISLLLLLALIGKSVVLSLIGG